MNSIKVIVLDAETPYGRGVQYGQRAKEEIGHSIEYYRKKFEKNPGWEKIIEFSREFVQTSKEFSSEAMEEIQGIADGSGYDVREIMAVNARYELSQFDWQKECTTGVFFDKSNGKNYIFKNCDLGFDVKPHLVILHIIGKDGFRALGITEAGQLVRDGYNNCGVALVNSALRSTEDHAGIAVPGTIVRKKVWESRNFSQACAIQRNLHRTVSTNMLVADKYGNAVDFECYPGGEDEVTPKDGIISTGNRFTVNPERNKKNDPEIDRGLRLRQLLEDRRNDICAETIMEILRDHEGYPYSICRHDHEEKLGTVYSVIINMTDDKIYICLGNPCESAYEEYDL